jgi:hypothetical protein
MIGLSLSNHNSLIRPHIVFTDGRQQQPNHNTTTNYVYWRTTTTIKPIIIPQYVVVFSLGCLCCRLSVNTICGRIMIGLIVVVMFTDRRQQRQPNHNTTTYCVYWRKTTTTQSLYDHILCLLTEDNCRCLPSVNTICGRIMIGLSLLSSVSKYNMWSCYDWVDVVVILCLLMDDNNDNPIIIRPHIMFTDGRQQRQPSRPSVNTICGRVMIELSLSSVSKHNMWSYYNPIIIRPHIVFTDDDNDNPIIIRPRLSLSSVSKHNMWSYYDWVVVVVVSKHNMWSYYEYDHILCLLIDDNNDNPIIMRPHIVFTGGRQRQP